MNDFDSTPGQATGASTTAAIELDSVSFRHGDTPVLRDVSLSVQAGRSLGVIGPNGGGKTTLLKLLIGQLRADAGRVSVLGTTPSKACQGIGYVPQYPGFRRDFPITVRQMTLHGRLGTPRAPSWWQPTLRRFRQDDQDAVVETLTRLGMADRIDTPIADLSGGMLQRALLARALVAAPKLLLLDEPTTNVDHPSVDELHGLLSRFDPSMAILLVSHDTGFVASFVDSVACVNQTVSLHPTHELNATVLRELYGDGVRAVSRQF